MKTKPLVYPFTFEEWKAHPSTKPKLKWCAEIGKKIDEMIKYGKQIKLEL